MNDATESISKEKRRLKRLKIPYVSVRYTNGIVIATLSPEIFSRIVSRRENGDPVKGYFLSENEGKWSASFIDHDGRHKHKDKLTECRALRWILGYPIGRPKRNYRYAGQRPYTRRRSTSHSR